MTEPRPSPAAPDDDGFAPTVMLHASHPPASHDALPAGSLIGEYEILDVLGEGGFGIVYLAHDPVLDRPVAIKEYLPVALAARSTAGAGVTLRAAAHADTFSAGMKSFINEGRMLARFDHPALVRVHRFWQENRTAYMAMPYYEGTTLQAQRHQMQQPPDEAWLRKLIDPLLGALEVMHAENCYHRDISPDNILLLRDSGQPVLLDFGAARRVIEDRTQLLTAILKPAFAPIEQYAEGSRVHQGPWTDLYALAAVLRYCMTGNPPLSATARAVEDQMQPMTDIARTISTAFPHLQYSESLLRAIDWALAVLPQDRPRSVAQWREALAGGPVGRPRPSGTLFSLPTRTPADAANGLPPQAAPLAAHLTPPGAEDEPVDAAVRAALDAALSGFETLPHLRTHVPGEPTVTAESANALIGRLNEGHAPSYDTPPPRRSRLLRWGGAVALVGVVAAAAGPLQRYVQNERGAARLAEVARAELSGDTAARAADAKVRPAPASAAVAKADPQPDEIAGLDSNPPAAGVTAAPTAPTSAAHTSTSSAAAQVPLHATGAAPAATTAASTAVPAVHGQAPSTHPAPPPAAAVTQASANATTAAPKDRPATSSLAARTAAPAGTTTAAADAGEGRAYSPRVACGAREQFALYRCMQTQCQRRVFMRHAQCKALRERDEIIE